MERTAIPTPTELRAGEEMDPAKEPKIPKRAEAHPITMFAIPHTKSPKERPIVLTIGTVHMFPVAQRAPPNMAKG